MRINTVFPVITEKERRLPFYPASVGTRESQEHIVRPSGFPDYHRLRCKRGKGILLLSGREYMILPNCGFLMAPGVPHEYDAVEEPWETDFLTFL